jgi:hypothetical protein
VSVAAEPPAVPVPVRTREARSAAAATEVVAVTPRVTEVKESPAKRDMQSAFARRLYTGARNPASRSHRRVQAGLCT